MGDLVWIYGKKSYNKGSEVMDVPSLETLKVRLDRGSELLMQLQVSLFTAGEMDQMTSKGPFQAKGL